MNLKPIDELLDLYLNHQLNKEQQQELFDRINNDQEEETATAWFKRIWEDIHIEIPDRNSQEAFLKLKTKLSLKDDNTRFHNFSRESYSAGGFGIKTFSRYAAVFLLAFGLAWLVFQTKKAPVPTRSSGANVVYVPNGSKGYLTLEDGTQIWLNCGSRLTYNNFSNAPTREVFLEGEAFFDVRKNSNRPFIVKTSDLKVKVLGTRFNIKSYPSEKITETILVSGRVEIEEMNPASAGMKLITLEPNQKATFYSETGKLTIDKRANDLSAGVRIPVKQKIIETVNPELYTSWKDEKLIFNNERLESLVVKMERWYNVNITLKDTLLKNYRYTGKFEKENIEQAMHALKLATPLEYSIDKNNITLYLSGKNK
jgi:transmembrane sensor